MKIKNKVRKVDWDMLALHTTQETLNTTKQYLYQKFLQPQNLILKDNEKI
jgi:hypothetical protein